MSTYADGWFTTASGTGNQAFTGLGFQPTKMRFWATKRTSDTQNFVHRTDGSCTYDGEDYIQHAVANFADLDHTSNHQTSRDYIDRVINMLDRSGGVIYDSVVITVVSFDADGFTLNFGGSGISNYRIHIEAFA